MSLVWLPAWLPTCFWSGSKKPVIFPVLLGVNSWTFPGFLPCSCCGGCPKDQFAASGVVLFSYPISEKRAKEGNEERKDRWKIEYLQNLELWGARILFWTGKQKNWPKWDDENQLCGWRTPAGCRTWSSVESNQNSGKLRACKWCGLFSITCGAQHEVALRS